jgi:hypothetical protein
MHATLKFHKRAKKKLSLIKIFHKKHGWSVTVPNPDYSGRQPTRGEKHGWSVTEYRPA